MISPLQDVLAWINAEVRNLSGHALLSVERAMRGAQSELTKDLSKAKWLGTDQKYTAQVHRNALIQLNHAIASIEESVGDQVESALQRALVPANGLAIDHLTHEVEMFSSHYEGSIRPIALDPAIMLAQEKKILWPRFESSAARYAGAIGDDIRQQLAIGMLKGETVDQLTTRLAKHGGPKGLVYTRGKAGDPGARAEQISEGLFSKYRSWGERLVRTEVVHAYNKCALIGMDELESDDPGYFKRWDACEDAKLCRDCAGYDNLVVPLKSSFYGIDAPPLHPNCRCAVCIWRKEWTEQEHKYNPNDIATRARDPEDDRRSIPRDIKIPKADRQDPDRINQRAKPISPQDRQDKRLADRAELEQKRQARHDKESLRRAMRESKEVLKEQATQERLARQQARDLARKLRLAKRKLDTR